jgi:hypothetical protein
VSGGRQSRAKEQDEDGKEAAPYYSRGKKIVSS